MKTLTAILIILILIYVINLQATTRENNELLLSKGERGLPQSQEVSIETLIYNITGEVGLKIAWCESRYNPLAENPNSSAKGIFQFIDGTWDNYCIGDVFNARDNIECFKKLYKHHPSWWECHYLPIAIK